jgi:hypothetical protein
LDGLNHHQNGFIATRLAGQIVRTRVMGRRVRVKS